MAVALVEFKGEFGRLISESRAAGSKAGDAFSNRFGSDLSGSKGLAGRLRPSFRSIRGDADTAAAGVLSSFSGAFKKVAGVAALALAGGQALSFAKDIVSAGSNMDETLSKSNTVFGKSGKVIEDWSKGAASSFGQSQQQALEAAGTFGNLFVQLGIGSAEAAKLSKSQVELASDFASFHNTSPEQAIEAMTAAYRGEYDAVQRYVPTISAAAVEQKALEMGLAGSTSELDAQDKALAVQKLLMEGAGDAVGDFDRTSGGLANTQRRLSAVWGDAKAELGKGLLPAVTSVASFFADRLPGAIVRVKGAFSSLSAGWKGEGGSDFFSRIGAAARTAWTWITETAVPAIKGAVKDLIAGWRGEGGDNFFSRLASMARNAWTFITETAVPAIKGAVKDFTAGFQGESDGGFFGNLGKEMANVVRIIRDEVLPWLRDRLLPWFRETLIPFITETLIPGWLRFASTMQNVWANVWGAIQTAWGFIQPILAAVWGFVVNTLIPLWLRFAGVMSTVWAGVWRAIQMAWGFIQPILMAVWNYITVVVIPMWQRIFTVVSTVFRGVWAAIQMAWGLIQPILAAIWATIRDFLLPWFQRIWDKAVAVFNGVRDAVVGAWENHIKPKFDAIVKFVSETLVPIWDKISSAVGAAFDKVPGIIQKALRAAGNVVAGFLSGAAGIADKVGLTEIAKGLKDAAVSANAWGEGNNNPHVRGGGGAYGLNKGGSSWQVPGRGPNKDTVPAMLTRGEYVWDRRTVDRNRGLIEGIHQGKYAQHLNGGGGVMSRAQVAGLAAQAGFGDTKLPVAVAQAESGLNPNAVNRNSNGTTDRGLWQINSIHGALSTFDPAANARAAFSISGGGRNWRPWTVYKTGAYRKFLDGGDPGGGGGVIDAVSERISSGLRDIASGALERAWPEMDGKPGLMGLIPGGINYVRKRVLEHVRAEAAKIEPPPTGGSGLPGSTSGLNPDFLKRFNDWNAAAGGRYRIGSGFRSYAQQAHLYNRWINRVPGQARAAPPGRSNHERGLAIDTEPSVSGAHQALARQFRLHFPVRGEPWHVEPFNRGGLVTAHDRNFDAGGVLSPGWNLVNNETGADEQLTRGGGPLFRDVVVQDRTSADALLQQMSLLVGAGRL